MTVLIAAHAPPSIVIVVGSGVATIFTCNVLKNSNDHRDQRLLLSQQAVYRFDKNNGLVDLHRNWTHNHLRRCQGHIQADDRRDLAKLEFVPLLMRADMLAHQFDRLQDTHRQQLV
jgi:hypothetical protein